MLFSQLFFAFFFFFNDTATTEIYTLSLHDALPISVDHVLARLVLLEPAHPRLLGRVAYHPGHRHVADVLLHDLLRDRKSTRLNSSHANISYAVFCLKKKKHCTNRSIACIGP